MDKHIFEQYNNLITFLSTVLGPDYEIVLHDVKDYDQSIVAIANGHISGRSIGAPLTDVLLDVIASKEYLNKQYRVNHNAISKDGKVLRSSSFFIKDKNQELAGILCINFDDSRYVDITKQILSLCHPDEVIEHNSKYDSVNSILEDGGESLSGSIVEVIDTVIGKVLSNKNIPMERLTQEERMSIVDHLDQKGVFMLKGAVSEVAKQLCISEPSVYRYLNKLNR